MFLHVLCRVQILVWQLKITLPQCHNINTIYYFVWIHIIYPIHTIKACATTSDYKSKFKHYIDFNNFLCWIFSFWPLLNHNVASHTTLLHLLMVKVMIAIFLTDELWHPFCAHVYSIGGRGLSLERTPHSNIQRAICNVLVCALVQNFM